MAASGGGGSLSIVSAGEDEGVWDSMAVMAAESWNKGSVDELGSMTREDLLPQGIDIKSLTREAAGEIFLTGAQTGLTEVLKELYETLKKEQRTEDNTLTLNEDGGRWLLSYKDEDGYTALHRASYNGHIDAVKYLLTIGADVQANTNDGWTPLHSAARWNKVSVVSLLMQNGADINSLTNGNQTPLHLASCNGAAKETIECLLWEEDCDLSICNDKGETAQELAISYGKHGYLFEMREESIECII